MKDATLGQIAIRLLFVIALVMTANLLLFTFLYADTFAALTLPYTEDFSHLERLVYRQFGGNWRVQDGALLQVDQNNADLFAVIPLHLDPTQGYRFESEMHFVSGSKGAGLLFNMQHADNRQQSQLVRFGIDPQGVSYLVFGYFDENLNFVSQGSISPFEAIADAERATLAVIVHDEYYDVVVNDETIQANLPLQYFGGALALTTWFSQVEFDNIEVDPATVSPLQTNLPLPESDGVLFSDSFDDLASQSNWERFSGDWTYEPSALVQTNVNGFDFGASASGTFGQFTLKVQFQHREGEGGGVLFNMPYRDSQRGAQMVRYFPDNTLAWGYFDERSAFQGQGSVAVSPASTLKHVLEIRTDSLSYAITLDGAPIVENVPLVSKSGFVGLTASQSIVSFEQVDVLAPGAQIPAAVLLEGDWLHSGETIVQQTTAAGNYFTSTGVSAETFKAAVQITMTEGTGGGLAFGGATDDNVAGAYVVRFNNSGRSLEWGILDQQMQFYAQGNAALTASEKAAHLLEINVGVDVYSVSVDGILVASDIPIAAQSGWIAFTSIGGPVTFENFRLSLTGITD